MHSPPDETYETQGAFDEPPDENDVCPDLAPPDGVLAHEALGMCGIGVG
jgi:hypothetical protein